MNPRVDYRTDVGSGPGLHALICGVSYYHHLPGGDGKSARQTFGITQSLESPATTAAAIFDWLVAAAGDLQVPLATVRLLLSPSRAESTALQKYAASRCTWGNFDAAAKAWHADACSHPGNYTLFYFSGHGVQRSGDDVVLLMEDYGDGQGAILSKGVPVSNLKAGMAPGGSAPVSKVARHQFYFIDSCRVEPDVFFAHELNSTGDVLIPVASPADDRSYPMFFASIPGTAAMALQNKYTVFGEAVLEGLKGGSAKRYDDGNGADWWITSHSLAETLTPKLQQLNRAYKVVQQWQPGGSFQFVPLVRSPGPPQAAVALQLDPLDALSCTELRVTDMRGASVSSIPKPVKPHPYLQPLPVGVYQVSAIIDPPNSDYVSCSNKEYIAEWPEKIWKVRVRQ